MKSPSWSHPPLRSRALRVLALAVLAGASLAPAPPEPAWPSVDTAVAQKSTAGVNEAALVIGIEQYDVLSAVPYAEADARAF